VEYPANEVMEIWDLAYRQFLWVPFVLLPICIIYLSISYSLRDATMTPYSTDVESRSYIFFFLTVFVCPPTRNECSTLPPAEPYNVVREARV
jgi:hypothetical protein